MLARLAVRSIRSKDLEIIVLRHQLTVLRCQVNRPTIHDADRTLLGAIAAALPAHGELTRLGHRIALSTVWKIPTTSALGPTPERSEVTWSQFLHSQAAVACDFFTVDTANPTGAWRTKAAHNLFLSHYNKLASPRSRPRQQIHRELRRDLPDRQPQDLQNPRPHPGGQHLR